MAEPSTLARPYAEAVFRLADGAGKLPQWSDMLAELAQVAADGSVCAAINDPNMPAAKVAGLFIGILSGRLIGEAENMVRVLAENRRLDAGGSERVLGSIITAAPEMLKVARTIERVASADVSVMLLGASGTGK